MATITDARTALVTPRLNLRQWRDEDLHPFAALNGDAEVMRYFPATLTKAESDTFAGSLRSLIAQRGWGLWAVEVTGVAPFIGYVGLHVPTAKLPCGPCVEIGWRLARAHWSKGYASEAASAALSYAFEQLELEEVVSFTAAINKRSAAVMRKIGMTNSGENFRHPNVDDASPLCEHVLYKIQRAQWLAPER